MTTQQLVTVGVGGFGREILDVIDAINADAPARRWDVIGVLDDIPAEVNLNRLEARRVPYLGTTDQWLESGRKDARFVIGIGHPAVRRRIASKLEAAGLHGAEPLIHPSASMGHDVLVGTGSVICAGARLTTNISVGRHVHINLNATVGHDSIIEDYVSVNPLASISGDCYIGSGTLVGVAAVVLEKRTVGRDAVLGGSTCVTKAVPDGVVVTGVPGSWRDPH